MLDERKITLVQYMVECYIASAQPVASIMLVRKYQLSYSPATVRNEFASLEDEGYVRQPHASSGRIPTERAYQLYLEQVQPKRIPRSVAQRLESAWARQTSHQFDRYCQLGRVLSDEAEEFVFVSLQTGELSCTGFAYLSQKPEFLDQKFASVVTEAIDHLHELVERLYTAATGEAQILIGRNDVFSGACGSIFSTFDLEDNSRGMIGIIGPMRMNYGYNIGLIKTACELVSTSSANNL
ncbi:hypothetical protein HYV71_03785 [Candidatus Uhrbacteria bacterium]|nr:hypothetical protein [Candidatus Uhrbacteria bacterium]